MTEQKKSNLKISTVKKKSKEYDQILKHEITQGDYIGEQISFSPLFSETKIEDLFVELGKLLNEAKEKGIEISQQLQIHFIQFLIIKHFTHFKKDIPDTLLGEGKNAGFLDMLEHFRKTGLFKECLDEMFLPQEIRKVFSRLTDFASTSLLSMQLTEEMDKKLKTLKLKNKDVFDELAKMNMENPIVQ